MGVCLIEGRARPRLLSDGETTFVGMVYLLLAGYPSFRAGSHTLLVGWAALAGRRTPLGTAAVGVVIVRLDGDRDVRVPRARSYATGWSRTRRTAVVRADL
jgi:hypothetical protein